MSCRAAGRWILFPLERVFIMSHYYNKGLGSHRLAETLERYRLCEVPVKLFLKECVQTVIVFCLFVCLFFGLE